MKSVKNAHFYQLDNKVKQILTIKGIEVLTSVEAYKKYSWLKKYFSEKPKEGYFIWVKKQIDFPLITCISLASFKVCQNLKNFLLIEEGLKIKANVYCNALKKRLCGIHQAEGKIILKKGAELEYLHFHSWGDKDIIEPNYEFYLEKDSKLDYTYKNLKPPKQLHFKNLFEVKDNAQVNLKINLLGNETQAKLEEEIILRGKNAKGIATLRLVGEKNSQIEAISRLTALNQTIGHLDCQGLLVDKKSQISLIPNLICKNKKAQLTHEASIGKISEEELMYLRSRGFSLKEAINLIINGFLKK